MKYVLYPLRLIESGKYGRESDALLSQCKILKTNNMPFIFTFFRSAYQNK